VNDTSGLVDLTGRTAIVTGGTGILGSAMACGLASAGARVGVLGRRLDRAESLVRGIEGDGGQALALPADVLDRDQLEKARNVLLRQWGRLDILVNAAGGNMASATVSEHLGFFDLPAEALRAVVDLNLMGTLLPCQVFGKTLARSGPGCIVNISSMAAGRALTRVVGYGAAKAGVEQLTRWLAVEMARSHGQHLRVNAIAPGFFVTDQNRDLLLDANGPTERGRTILDHTPAGRFGEPEDLLGTLLWLCGPGAAFVTGVVVPVDGGFSAFSGV